MNTKTEQMMKKLQGKIDIISIIILAILLVAIVLLIKEDRSKAKMDSMSASNAPPARLNDAVAKNPDFVAFQRLSNTQKIADFPQYQPLVRNTVFDVNSKAARENARRVENQQFAALKAQLQPIVDKVDKKETVRQEEKDNAVKQLTEFLDKVAPANIEAIAMLNKIAPPKASEPSPAPAAMPGMAGAAGMPGMAGMPGAAGMPGMAGEALP